MANSEWMFEETRKYVKERKAFGKTLANLQVSLAGSWRLGLIG